MKAITFSEFGTADVLQVTKQEIPTPKNDEVLIKVYAAGLNPIDYKIREGSSFVAKSFKHPFTKSLGYELAGEITAVGKDIHSFSIGDAVLGLVGFPNNPRCYAEYVCTKTDNLIKKPKQLSYIAAGGLSLAGLTAIQTIELANADKNTKVLIHAGAGGVGHLVVQLAKLRGAYVITTASKRNHDFLLNIGADQYIDYKSEDFTTIATKMDAVIDLVGGETGSKSLQTLSPEGRLVTVPTVSADNIIKEANKQNLKAVGMIMQPDMTQLSHLAKLAASGDLTLEIGETFTLDNTQAAHTLLENSHRPGKIILIA